VYPVFAQVATAAEVASLDSKLTLLIQAAGFILTVAVLYFGADKVRAAITAWWEKTKADLQLLARPKASPDAATPAEETAPPARIAQARTLTPATGYDSAATTLLQQIAADPSVQSTTMTVVKSDGTYELKFTAKGGQNLG
jgi:hypothetical protein